jgi:tetratricopeptide (TPR) repeat protein
MEVRVLYGDPASQPLAEGYDPPLQPLGARNSMSRNRSSQACRRLIAVAAFALIAACVFPTNSVTPIPSEARDAFAAGIEAEAAGREHDAILHYRAAIRFAPRFVDAHRAYQNLRLASGFRGDLRREYRALLARDPDDAIAVYLFGRLASGVDEQHRACEKAVALSPDLYSAWVGLGMTALQREDPVMAREAFETAIRLDSSRKDAWRGRLLQLERTVGDDAKDHANQIARRLLTLGASDLDATRVLIRSAVVDGNDDEATDLLLDLLVADASDDCARFVAAFLEQHGRARDLERARAALAQLQSTRAPSAAWRELIARVEERCGDPSSALAVLVAHETTGEPRTVRLAKRRLLTATGQLDTALRDVVDDRYGMGFDFAGNDVGRELRELANGSLAALDGEAVASAVSTMMRHGLLDLSLAFARERLRADPTRRDIADQIEAALAHRRFVAELSAWFRAAYRDPDGAADLAEFLAAAKEISLRTLHRDVVEPVVTREYFAIGRFLDPDPENGGGLARYFDSYGQFFVVGERRGGSVDGYLLNRISDARIEVGGLPVLRVLGEDLVIPSRIENRGGEIAGFALESFIVLNVDRARATADRVRQWFAGRVGDGGTPPAVLDDAIDPVTDDSSRADLVEPGSVVLRTWLRSYGEFLAAGGAPAEYAGLVLDAVEVHERAHIRDAQEFLPVFDDLPRKIGILAEHAFSGANIEAWLEGRAQADALADARDPRIALAELLRDLPERDASPPHSAGYYDVAKELVALVVESENPAIDRGGVALQQLDRLSAAELRAYGRRLASRMKR